MYGYQSNFNQERPSNLQAFDKIDFSKPQNFIREITDFLNSVTLVTDIQLKSKGRSISNSDA